MAGIRVLYDRSHRLDVSLLQGDATQMIRQAQNFDEKKGVVMSNRRTFLAAIVLIGSLFGSAAGQLRPKTPPPVTPRQTQPIDVPSVIVAGGNGARRKATRNLPQLPTVHVQALTPATTQTLLQKIKGKKQGDVSAPSFVTLTTRQPFVAGKGNLLFEQPVFVYTQTGDASPFDQYASFNFPGDAFAGNVVVQLKPEHIGQSFLVSL